jgi:hypothetical protein
MEAAVHLAQEQIDGYRRRTLAPADLLAVDDHLTECPECRLRVAEGADLGGSIAAWEALAEGATKLPPVLPFRAGPAPVPPLRRGRRAGRVALWAAALALAALGAAWLATLPLRRQMAALEAEVRGLRRAPAVAAAPIAPQRGPAGALVATPLGNGAPGAPDRLALKDGGRPIRLDAQGRLTGLEGLPESAQRRIAGALAARRLALPAVLGELASAAGTLRGPSAETELAPLAPVGAVVRSPRPVFRWTRLPGASGYRIRVFDAGFALVAASPETSATEWTPRQGLSTGKLYTWQIVARRDGAEVTAPVPPQPEARFALPAAAVLDELSRAEGASPRSHLALGVLYAEAGLTREAEQELGALAAENPGSEAARDLLASLRRAPLVATP